MNAANVHLFFNHFPIVLTIVGLLILVYSEWKHHLSYKKLGLIIFVMAAILTIPVQFSGEGAEHILESMNAVDNHDLIERHESTGFWSAMLLYLIGILSFISLIMINNVHSIFSHLRKLIIVLGAVGIVMILIAAHQGGEIRHLEIRGTLPF